MITLRRSCVTASMRSARSTMPLGLDNRRRGLSSTLRRAGASLTGVGVGVLEFPSDDRGCRITEVVKDDQSGTPTDVRGAAISGRLVCVTQLRQRICLAVAVAFSPVQAECVEVVADGLLVASKSVVGVPETIQRVSPAPRAAAIPL